MSATLRTARLLLLPWSAADAVAFAPIATDPLVMRYITGGAPWSEQQIQEFVSRQIEHYAARGFCLWKLVHRTDGRLIGFCGLQPLVLEGVEEIEIGWWLAPSYWKQGLTTEAARAALDDARTRCSVRRVIAIARPDNAASIRVMQKLEMSFEREATHKWIPILVYSASFEKS